MAAGRFEEQICNLATARPFEQVRSYLKRFEGVELSETMIRETAERSGKALISKEEEEALDLDLKDTETAQTPEFELQYLFIDGGMVPIRPESGKNSTEYKEVKIGLSANSSDIERSDDGSPKIKQKHFVSSLGKGVKHFELLMRGFAGKMGLWKTKTLVVISDGAEWIDQLRLRLFPNSIHILDWYHATEHLWDCGKNIFGEHAHRKVENWVRPLEALLWQGRVDEVCNRLLDYIKEKPKKETVLRQLYTYYHTRLDKMRYDYFRSKGYFIGSGAVESSMKYLIQSRLKQAGMKWDIDGASSIIKLQEKNYENNWEKVWDNRKKYFSYG